MLLFQNGSNAMRGWDGQSPDGVADVDSGQAEEDRFSRKVVAHDRGEQCMLIEELCEWGAEETDPFLRGVGGIGEERVDSISNDDIVVDVDVGAGDIIPLEIADWANQFERGGHDGANVSVFSSRRRAVM